MVNRYFLLIFLISGCSSAKKDYKETVSSLDQETKGDLTEFVSDIQYDSLGGQQPRTTITRINDHIIKVNLAFSLSDTIHQDDWKLTILPSFKPEFHWAPHLTPTDEYIIARHVFRSPALVVSNSKKTLSVIPDLDLINGNLSLPWYMDLSAQSNRLVLGLSRSKVKEHVLFVREKGMVIPPSKLEFGFYLLSSKDSTDIENPWRRSLKFLWEQWGGPLFEKGQPIKGSLDAYTDHTYHWALESWKEAVWQEFKIKGKKVGAPVFIVNVTQSPNYPGLVSEREFRSVWNQAWFSSLRSAQGLYRYAIRKGNLDYLDKARMTKELALLFPQNNGLFPSVIGTEMEKVKVQGKEVSRSRGWSTYYFGNSNRNPVMTWGKAAGAPLHILDMSWTAYQMLTWYDELEHDERLLSYATRYADRLVKLQDQAGFFPAWLDKNQKPLPFLQHSPESSLSATFLLKMHQLTKKEIYFQSAEKAITAVMKDIIPAGQWEDYETYWSCSRVLDTLLNKKIVRNNMFKQNTLSMYWTAEALLNFYEATGKEQYLLKGERVLDELLMYQASWQPGFIPIHALGGFGVMNADGEWNDSRQSLFAELILRYGKVLKRTEYTQRGLAALRSSFVMMYCPENPETLAQWEKVYPYFNEKDYGFMMENYGHGGEANEQGLGIGEFTIYDWGNGAAAEAYNRILDHYGEAFVNPVTQP